MKAEETLGAPYFVSTVLSVFTVILLICFIILLGMKTRHNPSNLIKDFLHLPGKALLSSISCTVIIISGLPAIAEGLQFSLWLTASAVHLAITGCFIGQWLRSKKFTNDGFDLRFFIPITGCMMVTVQGSQFLHVQLFWFLLSVSILFWLLLSGQFLFSLKSPKLFSNEKLPMLFILISPPSIAFIAHATVVGTTTLVSETLFYLATSLSILVIFIHSRKFRGHFSLCCWSAPFPLAALTLASFEMSGHKQTASFFYASLGLFFLLTMLIVALTIITGLKFKNKYICQSNVFQPDFAVREIN